MALDVQSSELPPAQPSYIFRGHSAHIHCVHFIRRNTRLVTADADGWLVIWKLESRRPVAVWRPHTAPVLGIAEWGSDKIVTHGRDNSLRVWQFRAVDEANLSSILPADDTTTHHPQPWLLHSLVVNTLNFCSFSTCFEPAQSSAGEDGDPNPILVAVPARDDKKVEVYHFPSEKLVYVVPRVQPTDTGMVMTLKILHHPSKNLLVIAGYEGGFTAIHQLDARDPQSTAPSIPEFANTVYLSQPHTQPILSLDVLPDAKVYFTSSADALIVAHRIPEPAAQQTKQAANASTTLVDSTSLQTEQKHSSTSSDSPLDFTKKAIKPAISDPTSKPSTNSPSLLAAALASEPSETQSDSQPVTPHITHPQPPYKIAPTKHAGQQSLSVRSDGRIIATAGWDGRVRVYSTKSLKELAVLKWHKDGVYAVAFAEILQPNKEVSASKRTIAESSSTVTSQGDQNSSTETKELQRADTASGLSKLQRQREEQMQSKHWIVAGAKDGKVSLWEIY